MTRYLLFILIAFFITVTAVADAGESTWPQFRGSGGLGLRTGKPPIAFSAEKDAEKNLRWKVAVPHGHSFPCIWENKISQTGLDQNKLIPFCLNRANGTELWRAVAPVDKIQSTHRIGSAAAPTACTDGERVFVYFGSFGILAYDMNGKKYGISLCLFSSFGK